MQGKMDQAVKFLACFLDVTGSNPDKNTENLDVIVIFLLFSPDMYQNNTLKQATTTSFHFVFSTLFIINQSFEAVWADLLTV